MVLDTIDAYTLEIGDAVIIDDEECIITHVIDNIVIVVTYTNEFNETLTTDFDPFHKLEIWGN